MFLVFFYLSNFRAVLVSVEYEKAIDTPQDIVNRGQPVYLHNVLHDFLTQGAKHLDKQPNPLGESMALAESLGGVFPYRNGWMGDAATRDVARNGASFVGSYVLVLHYYTTGKVRPEQLVSRLSREALSLAFMVTYVKRGVAWKEDVDIAMMRMSEGGIVNHIVRNGVSALHLSAVVDPTSASSSTSTTAVSKLEPLNVRRIRDVCLFLVGGFAVAFLFLLAESRHC